MNLALTAPHRVHRWMLRLDADVFHFYRTIPGPAVCGREPIDQEDRPYIWRAAHGPARTERCRECDRCIAAERLTERAA